MLFKLLKNKHFSLLLSLTLSTTLAFGGFGFIFSIISPPVYGAGTANAWNLERASTDLNVYFSTSGTNPTALQLNQSGQMRARTILDLDNPSYLLDPSSTGTSIAVAGSVGIGTTNPATLLNLSGSGNPTIRVNSTSLNNPGVEIVSAGATGFMQILGAGAMNIGYSANAPMSFKTNNTTQMTVLGNGNVGIGTAAPSQKLELQQSSATNPLLSLAPSTDATSERATMTFGANSGLTQGWVFGQDRASNGTRDMYLYDLTNSRDVMYWSTAGNVGIGNASPGQKLQVGTGGGFDNEGVIRTGTRNGGGSREWDFGAGFTTFGSNYGFNIKDTGVNATRMTIDLNGKVGLKTTSPIADLHIKQSSDTQYTGGIVLESSVNSQRSAIMLGTTKLFLFAGEQASGATGFGTIDLDGNYARNAWSSKELKENVHLVNDQEILDKLDKLPINEWNYKVSKDTVKHIGPFAEDFYDIFGLNDSRTTINGTDQAGVTMVGVKALSAKVREQDKKIEQLQQQIDELKKALK